MKTTKLSSKGQVIIPKALRTANHWEIGMELLVVDTGEGILLKPKPPFAQKSLDEVAGCLPYPGDAKTLKEIDAAVARGLREEWRGRS
jgi:AbrB family looped-hinge helix DNA binding protein